MLEVWGGVECSVVRIRNTYRNQIAETGHRDRPEDLDRIAGLGIKTLRFPILWEEIAPRDPDQCDWSWHDTRLARLERLGIKPVAGLLHHGSGPRYTSLLDPAFPGLFARHAQRVAARYPWLELFTPINEPLTTARFAGLYGHWYPHRRQEADFSRMVVNQCQATVLAMRAIREIIPQAQLVQTEDVGLVFSTRALAHQAAFDTTRRWLSLDLLCGRVNASHPWFERLLAHGIPRSALDQFAEQEVSPDLIGANYYLTSDRYLDERLGTYPRSLWGGSARRRYADAEAMRVPHLDDLAGPKQRLQALWERYRRPIAVSEVHHGCTREEQLRWLAQVWREATELRAAGVPIRAVTAWSLFGAYDWNSLMRRRAGHYEPGAFDVRSPQPRLTALGRAVRELARSGRMTSGVLATPGWWRRPGRCYGRPAAMSAGSPALGARVLIIAGAGAYGDEIARICDRRGLTPLEVSAESLPDALDGETVLAVIDPISLATAAAARRDPDERVRADLRGGERVATWCAAAAIPLLAFSSSRVFEGAHDRAALESDPVRPASGYGASEALREARILGAHPAALVVRPGPVFGLADPDHPVIQRQLGPAFVSPSYLPDLIHAALDLSIDAETGLWHLVNAGAMSGIEFAARLAPPTEALPSATARPATQEAAALASERGQVMPPLRGAIDRYRRSLSRQAASLRMAAE